MPAGPTQNAPVSISSDVESVDLITAFWSSRTATDIAALLAIWGLLLACMAVAQTTNLLLGFAVWPVGEDRVWIDILQKGTSIESARAFWQINDRNPLAPWWYIGLKPLILGCDAGLLATRYFVGLLLALSSYLFLFALSQGRTFALGVASVIVVFLANGYIDQIYWIMQLALVFSLCCLTLYKLFLTRPDDYRFYTAAIVSWFIALGTYSVQTGALLAVPFLALTAPATTMFVRVKRVVIDTLPFAAILVVFWLEWQTTARDVYIHRPHLGRAISSIFEAFWHFDYLAFFNGVVYVAFSYRLIFLVTVIVVSALVFYTMARHDRSGGPVCRPLPLLQTTIAVSLLMLPVVAVEATGYGIVGEAWRKVYQFTIPFLYLSIVAALLSILPVKVARLSWRIVVALFAALATAVTLGINRVQVEVTQNERLLRSALNRLAQENMAEGSLPPYHFVIRREPGFLWYSSDFLSPVYARTWALSPPTSFRFLPGAHMTDRKQFLRYTDAGVENATLDGTLISNDHVFLLSATTAGIRRVCRFGAEDVSSPVVEWQRTTELVSNVGDCRSSASGARRK